MDNAKIYKCFIASPSDVMEERNACDEIFESINKSIGESQLFRIESVRWEKDAVPEFASDGQDVINKQLTPGDHDILLVSLAKNSVLPLLGRLLVLKKNLIKPTQVGKKRVLHKYNYISNLILLRKT